MPSRTLFGMYYLLTSVGIQILFVRMRGFLRAKQADGQMMIPRFFLCFKTKR